MNKRNVEYTYQGAPVMRSVAAWLEEMAEDRWELVCSHKNAFIFRRPIIDEYYKSLQLSLEHNRRLNEDVPSDYSKGVVYGLTLAYSMYTI